MDMKNVFFAHLVQEISYNSFKVIPADLNAFSALDATDAQFLVSILGYLQGGQWLSNEHFTATLVHGHGKMFFLSGGSGGRNRIKMVNVGRVQLRNHQLVLARWAFDGGAGGCRIHFKLLVTMATGEGYVHRSAGW